MQKNREQMKSVIEEQRVIGLVLVEKRLNHDETYPSQWPYMQGVLAIWGPTDCENGENRMEVKPEWALPPIWHWHCSTKNVFVCQRGRMEARTASLDWLSSGSTVTDAVLFVSFCHPRALRKREFAQIYREQEVKKVKGSKQRKNSTSTERSER